MVTILELAKAVDVSVSTVSRAFSSPELVSQSTREKVLQAAAELGYQPSRAARGLVTGHTGALGLIVPDLENPTFAAIAKGVQARARALGYAVYVADTDEDVLMEPEVVRSLANDVDGLLICAPRTSEAELVRTAESRPVVLVNRDAPGVSSVSFDNAGGVRQGLRHLHALGHRRIAWVGGPSSSWSERQRRDGVKAAAEELGDVEIVYIGDFSSAFAGGVAAADQVLASGATAAMAFNDLIALGVISRLHARGISVPDQISVIGFDDIALTTFVSPTLTTVSVPLVQVGRSAVDRLVSMVRGEVSDARSVSPLPVSLVVRESTGVVPAKAALAS